MIKWLREDADFTMPRWWWFALAFIFAVQIIEEVSSWIT